MCLPMKTGSRWTVRTSCDKPLNFFICSASCRITCWSISGFNARYKPFSPFDKDATIPRSSWASSVITFMHPSVQYMRVMVRLRAVLIFSTVWSSSLGGRPVSEAVCIRFSTMVSRSRIGIPSFRRFVRTLWK